MKEMHLPSPWDVSYQGDVIVFDLDDTLALEGDFLRSGFRAVEGLLRECIGVHRASRAREVMCAAVDVHRRHFDDLESYLDYAGVRDKVDMSAVVWGCRNHIPDHGYRLHRGSEFALEALRRLGVVIGVITDGRSVTQRNKVRALRLEHYCHPADILISEEQGCDKRHEKSFRHFMDRYPAARRYIYIGDNLEKDFLMPRQLGWSSILLRDAGANHFAQPIVFDFDTYPPSVINHFFELIWKNEICNAFLPRKIWWGNCKLLILHQ